MTQTPTAHNTDYPNPFLNLNYEPAIETLGGDYFDIVTAAEFPQHLLRFRNDEILPILGLDPQEVTDEHFIQAFGQFWGVRPFLALRYHGYQFGEYNPNLGDGRGFLYGQVRGTDGELYDFGTKGSGRTPYSRTADGRLTLKGGVREVLAAEMLHRMKVKTSRCLSLVETGEQLWRGDEPSPTRSSVMIRFSRSHIRFGTFERLQFFKRKDLIQKLLDHVIESYYPNLKDSPDKYAEFYAELVQRVAELTAQWMAAGFCHAVLNTDNMSITGESFDYGPYAFIPTYDPNFTAAYFDYYGRYSYGNQPGICRLNLEMLQRPLSGVIEQKDLDSGLAKFEEYYHQTYRQRMLNKLGFEEISGEWGDDLLKATIQLLAETQISYPDFFAELSRQFSPEWREDMNAIFTEAEPANLIQPWREIYYHSLQQLSRDELNQIKETLSRYNPTTVIIRPEIEAIWKPITEDDNWQPFYDLLKRIKD
ncbi:YdiU family protein [Ancylothrix sp. C2]|uniref:protein adenylyltransferase SelO n=1 Tax=Ancylothrix sp. D3o TaxID=2953691 RepID=UPI0021BAD21D|nr:YdiU family protein [Ancylothrix sp. D3o]MCT7950336.1 YdiU family protein [Ancylothrix sp. D3o]